MLIFRCYLQHTKISCDVYVIFWVTPVCCCLLLLAFRVRQGLTVPVTWHGVKRLHLHH